MKNLKWGFIIIIMAAGWSCKGHDPAVDHSPREKKAILLFHKQQANFESEFHTVAWLFQKYVQDHSQNLFVKIYATNSPGTEDELAKNILSNNELSGAIVHASALGEFAKRMGMLRLPFFWKNYNQVHTILNGELGKILEKELELNGFIILAWLDNWGFENMVYAREGAALANLSGSFKMAPAKIDFYQQFIQKPRNSAEPAFQPEMQERSLAGEDNIFELSAWAIKKNHLYPSIDSIVLTQHLYKPGVLVFSKSEWEKLTLEDQKCLLDAARLAQEIECALAPVREQQANAEIAASGVTILPLQLSPMETMIKKAQDEIASECNALDLLEILRSYK